MKDLVVKVATVVLLICTNAFALDKSDIKSVISNYEEAFKMRSYGNLEYVFYSLDDCPHFALFSIDVEKVTIKEIEGNNVYVKMKYKNMRTEWEMNGWMQMTEDGKIKYDSLLMRHPIERAFSATLGALHEIEIVEKNLELPNGQPRVPYIDQLISTGVPVEGYGVISNKELYCDVLRWLISNGDIWDATEPKIRLPREKFDMFVKSAEKYL